ncbi:MAG: helix-turn-helix domain-containing protein [Maribacter litoralis]|uniref:helix-turn-helix domain-containing protein n=1 Tax=Maribacter litoralis TaxID=2059726 RepID=UPI003297116C
MNYFRIFKKTVFIYILLFQSSVLAQEDNGKKFSYPDSIRKHFYTDSTKTKKLIKAYILKSKNENNPEDVFDGYHALASFFYQYNDTLNLIKYTDKLFTVATSSNLKIELLKAYHLKNNILIMKSGLDDPRIINNIYAALKLAKEINSIVWECKSYDDIAGYYQLTGEFDQALIYYKKNLTLLNKIANSQDYIKFKIWGGSIEKTYLELSKIHIETKEIDSAKIYNKMAKSVLDSTHGNYHDVYRFRLKIQELEIDLLEDNVKLARKHLFEAFEIVPENFKPNFKDYSKLYYNGLISYHEGEYSKAIDYLEAIDLTRIKVDERAGFFHNNYYKTLYKSYLKTNNIKKADYYFEKHLASLKGQIKVNNSVNFNFKKNEIDQYNEEVQILKKQRIRQYLLLITITFVSLFLISFVIIRSRKKQKRDKEKIKTLIAQISTQKNEDKPKVASLNINDLEVERIIEKIIELEKKQYFLKVDCTMSNLAKKLKTNTTYLSKIINTHYDKNFTKYINDLRINYVLKRMKEDHLFKRYSIQSIANEIGFKSKETFNTEFKKRTGVMPSAVIKELKKESK